MQHIFFEYNEYSVTLYDALKNAAPSSDIGEIFHTFQKQLYSYADFEIKHFKKLLPFAKHKQLVNFLCDLLARVCPHYESKEFYYTLVVLSYSQEQKAIEYLGSLTEFMIANQLDLCHIVLTIFNEINAPRLMACKAKLEQYFEELYMQSDYFEFVKKVGLDTSKVEFKKTGGEGRFSFDLTNMNGIQYAFQLDNEIDKRKFCKLSISIFTPKGMRACFDISLTSEQFLLYHHHRDYCVSCKEEMKLLNKETNQEFYIENCTNLLDLKGIVNQIENVLQTRFDSNIVYSYFTKPLKGKKELQKWWEDHNSLS
ncbi:MAG: glycoprotein [Eubacteriales bacterium]|nr:glycoprotein [Eubacteriales bacterium]